MCLAYIHTRIISFVITDVVTDDWSDLMLCFLFHLGLGISSVMYTCLNMNKFHAVGDTRLAVLAVLDLL